MYKLFFYKNNKFFTDTLYNNVETFLYSVINLCPEQSK